MWVDYNKFSKTFSNSRKNMKWEEIDYFLSFLELNKCIPLLDGDDWKEEGVKVLDVWCWNWRFLSSLKNNEINFTNYLWVDLSKWLLDEAKKIHPKSKFLNLDMLNLYQIEDKFNCIFFIASFHHLESVNNRLEVLKKAYDILEEWWLIFLTNWSLKSELNKKKYGNSIIDNSENKFWSLDYSIKIWEYKRYYHCFDLSELEYLFKKAWFKIIENKEFDNKRNFISIIKKN